MEGVGLCDGVNGEGANMVLVGDNGVIQKADTDPAGNQSFDRNKTADGYFSAKITQRITGGIQTLFENTAGAGALFPDDNGLAEQILHR